MAILIKLMLLFMKVMILFIKASCFLKVMMSTYCDVEGNESMNAGVMVLSSHTKYWCSRCCILKGQHNIIVSLVTSTNMKHIWWMLSETCIHFAYPSPYPDIIFQVKALKQYQISMATLFFHENIVCDMISFPLLNIK